MRRVVVLVSMLSGPAAAADLQVCGRTSSEGCYASIAAALDVAVDGDTVLLGGGNYAEAVDLVGRDLTIRALPSTTTSLVGDGTDAPVLRIEGGRFTLESVFVGSPSARALEVSGGAVVTITGSTLSATKAQTNGGIVSVEDASLEIDQSTLFGGFATKLGGQIVADNGQLVLRDSRLSGGNASIGGSLFFSSNVPGGVVELIGTTFEGHSANALAGAALYAQTVDDGDYVVTVRNCRFEGNASAQLAAAFLQNASTVIVEDSIFHGNTSGRGSSALFVSGEADVTIRRAAFCANRSGDAATAGLLEVNGATSLDLTNSQFVDNGQTAVRVSNIASTSVRNNHFVGNESLFFPVLSGSGPITFTDNLAAYNVASSPLSGLFETQPRTDASHNLWWANTPAPSPDELSEDDVLASPQLEAYRAGLPCKTVAGRSERDPLWPSWYGAGRDQGSDRDVDLDGSALDIGAFGGSDARSAPDWDDADEDGVPALFDCDNFDATVGSGLPDPPYDGIDQDCRRDDDYDADDDGVRPPAHAEPGALVDCDDNDPRRRPGQLEIPSNGIDDDCDGWADNTGSLNPTACSTAAGGATGWMWGGLVLWAGRRRTRSVRRA